MIEIRINQLSRELFRTINVEKLINTFFDIRKIFIYFKFDTFFKIINNNDIIYTDYELRNNKDIVLAICKYKYYLNMLVMK